MKCKGFTLIELVITIVILGIAMSPLLVMYGNIVVKSTESQVMRVSSFLGQDLMEEILSKRYDENEGGNWTQKINLGCVVDGEDPTNKNTFDDVDDFIDWAPPGDIYFGEDFSSYTAQVQVFYVNPQDLNNRPQPDIGDNEYTHFKKIIVTIKHRGSDILDIVSVKQGY